MAGIRTSVRHRVSDRESASSSASSPEPPADDDPDYFMQNNDSVSSIAQSIFRDRPVSNPSPSGYPKNPIDRLPPEILISVFARLSSPHDLLSCLMVSKNWARNSVDLLWHRPLCNTWDHLHNVATSVQSDRAYFPYADLVKRLNLANISNMISDGTLDPFERCKRIERLTLTSCAQLTDRGIMNIVMGNSNLLALDVSGLNSITNNSIEALATNCPRLQGLNISNCRQVTDQSLIQLAENCKYLKRLKLNKCVQITDEAMTAFASCCLSMLEIDLQDCKEITDASITAILARGRGLRELRLAQCNLVTDRAFMQLPEYLPLESLRILDLTACNQLHDSSVEKIIERAPRLRILVLAKCTEITDRSVFAICKLGKNLHDIHLGRCNQISDAALIELVKACSRIRYIDLAGCIRVTDKSVKILASLPKLRRIGLVKCQAIKDDSIFALARNDRPHIPSNLERVHLSYCTNITLQGVHALLNNCPRLTHLSLTGIQAFFMDHTLVNFCREAPPEFNDEQRTVFCVFSGEGVNRLRTHLNTGTSSGVSENEGTMYDDGIEDDGSAEHMVGLMQGTQIGGNVHGNANVHGVATGGIGGPDADVEGETEGEDGEYMDYEVEGEGG